MSYFPVNDQAAFHPEFVAAGNASIGRWTRAGSWCKANVSGGRVPPEVAALLGTKREARKLVEVGLWEVAEDGAFQFHDLEHQARNFAPDQEKSRRQNDPERQRRKRERDRKAREEAEASRTDSRDESRDPSRDNDCDDQRESDRSHDDVTAPPIPIPVPIPSPLSCCRRREDHPAQARDAARRAVGARGRFDRTDARRVPGRQPPR